MSDDEKTTKDPSAFVVAPGVAIGWAQRRVPVQISAFRTVIRTVRMCFATTARFFRLFHDQRLQVARGASDSAAAWGGTAMTIWDDVSGVVWPLLFIGGFFAGVMLLLCWLFPSNEDWDDAP